MNVKKIGTVAIILLFGCSSLVFGESVSVENRVAVEKNNSVTEDEIMKALSGISTTTVMKSSAPKIVSESEPMVLSADRPKVSKKRIRTKSKKRVRRHRRVEKAVDMEDLPMAKSYPMSYDVSKITE